MKRIIIIAAMALMSVSAFAQKFAYVDFNELVMLVPEMDEARATIEENSKTNEEILMTMYEEYQSKVQQYEQKVSTWTQSVREIKEKEIMDIQSRLEQTQQTLQQELQQLQQQLQAPIVEKVNNVVNELAKTYGVVAVFEKSSFLYVDETQMLNLTPEARTALNIPEGRTLETLQAEMMAKAQTAQGM
ncbi:MAG: OmpH family outer membrane protein [Bacteroidales bacterium]|nr:OmpH family outer membrane protein [Bacteroidales bacterium]